MGPVGTASRGVWRDDAGAAEHLPPAPARVADIGGGVGRYAIELTRRGCVVAAFITPNSVVQCGLSQDIEYAVRDREELETILASGLCLRPAGKGWTGAWFTRPQQVEPLMSEGGFVQTDLLNCEALAYCMEARLNAAPWLASASRRGETFRCGWIIGPSRI